MPHGRIPRVTAAELKQRLEGAEAPVLLDVREPEERAIAAIPAGAHVRDLFVPMRTIPARLAEIAEVQRAAGAPLVVYCHHGVRSLMVAGWLAERGFANVFDLEGGIDAYSLEADPGVPRY